MLQDKVAVITGGTRGIGLETARTFLENGAKVIIFGSREESVQKAIATLEEEGFKADGYFPDLNDFESVSSTVEAIVGEHGQIDILVNNAGMSANKKIDDTSFKDFSDIIDLNVKGVFNVTKAIVPVMKERKCGVILNTSSMVSIYGQPSGVGYPASKFAVNGMTKSLARELASYGIRVNAVAPGVINTDMLVGLPKEQIDPIVKSIPLGRIGTPRDVANAFLFLASDYASYITGDVLSVDGAARC